MSQTKVAGEAASAQVKRKARVAVKTALRSGRLVRPDACERCGHGLPHAHHHDYAEPLDVEWLCPECHAWEHHDLGDMAPEQWWFVFRKHVDSGELVSPEDPGFMIDPGWPQH
jgi:hypothetical protein